MAVNTWREWSKMLRLALLVLFFFSLLTANASAKTAKKVDPPANGHGAVFAGLHIPHLDQSPSLNDFLGMQASGIAATKMLKIEGFQQRDPVDGAPISQKTEAYIGYTDKNLYVAAICFDTELRNIRARLARREAINDDDQFGFVLDTFHDKKHAVFFYLNPLGVQQDGIWDENSEPDFSFDMLWKSDAKITPKGYVVWFEIPFKSLRFSPQENQTWGIFFERDIRRNNEFAFYPHISSNAQGFLSQETQMDGIQKISPGRNLQFIPYASMRTFRELDDRDPNNPHFHGKHIEPRIGLDAKGVIKDSLVLDATVNPDFAQVESDDPQITTNQRFEVFFPEKRPFFLENSTFFNTPINLVFTRRIIDPEYGVRLTGKVGAWAIGGLFADDKSPGTSVPSSDPLAGAKAYFGIVRVSHDIGKESSVGLIYTDRELHTVSPATTLCTDDPCIIGANRVGGVDLKVKITSKWTVTGQAITGYTKFNYGTHKGGPSYDLTEEYSSSDWEHNAEYTDTAANFETAVGFFRRPDVRTINQFTLRRFRTNKKWLQWHGPGLFTINRWDHKGTRIDWFANANYRFILPRQTNFGFFGNIGHERLRPVDYDALLANRDYAHNHRGFFFNSGYFKQVSIGGELGWGQETNFDAAYPVVISGKPVCAGQITPDPSSCPPTIAKANYAQIYATIRPIKGLTIDNSYLLSRLRSEANRFSDFNNHIIRSKWNYQFSREFSLRFIGQYSTVLANPLNTSLLTTKSFNADVLFTYLVHPGTAVYVGYNSNLQNLDPALGLDPNGNINRTRDHFINDGRQFFVKISYLFRY
jgi:Domain of unknown function (DUF5916)